MDAQKTVKTCFRDRIIPGVSLVWDMAVEDLKSAYKGAVLGGAWVFIRPAAVILVYYIVFEFFFGMSLEFSDVPYAVWFLSGMLPWLYFADTLGGGITCYQEYSYLVGKIYFPIRLLPMVKVLSGFFVHLVFMAILGAVCIFSGSVWQIRLPVLLYSAVCLLVYTGLSVRLGAIIRVFFRDVSEFTGLFLQAGIWAVPILWDFNKVPAPYRRYFALNPMFHIVTGYRQAFGCGTGRGDHLFSAPVFWELCFLLAVISEVLFRRLEGEIRGES